MASWGVSWQFKTIDFLENYLRDTTAVTARCVRLIEKLPKP